MIQKLKNLSLAFFIAIVCPVLGLLGCVRTTNGSASVDGSKDRSSILDWVGFRDQTASLSEQGLPPRDGGLDIPRTADMAVSDNMIFCDLGDKRCSEYMLQFCNASGQWEDVTPCNNSACIDGACQGECTPEARRCSLSSPNTPQVCSSLGQWQDESACTSSTCVNGSCQGSCESGSSCTDGNACTQTDTCENAICIGSSPVICSALDQCHYAGTCDISSGVCSNPQKSDGTGCDDQNACTQTDTCQHGSCEGSSPVICSALDSCHDVGICSPSTGVCSNPQQPNGTLCGTPTDWDLCMSLTGNCAFNGGITQRILKKCTGGSCLDTVETQGCTVPENGICKPNQSKWLSIWCTQNYPGKDWWHNRDDRCVASVCSMGIVGLCCDSDEIFSYVLQCVSFGI